MGRKESDRTNFTCTFAFKGSASMQSILMLYINVLLLAWAPAVQFSSVAQSCPTLCDPMNHSTPGLSVHHQLPEFAQTHVH